MFRPRSYMAFAITPQSPIVDWLSELDASFGRSENFFAGQHVALDLSALNLSSNAISQLVANLEERNIRILGVEGVDPAKWQPGLPPVLRSDRYSRASGSIQTVASAAPIPEAERPPRQKQQPASLMIEDPVRSGQSVIFMEGDITILGSVGSGAEIVAGGSIHIYGALRGRALAGAAGNTRARIFCQTLEAELLAIGSHFKTADEIDEDLRHESVQVWLEGPKLNISVMR